MLIALPIKYFIMTKLFQDVQGFQKPTSKRVWMEIFFLGKLYFMCLFATFLYLQDLIWGGGEENSFNFFLDPIPILAKATNS